jgi:hypothetical protein
MGTYVRHQSDCLSRRISLFSERFVEIMLHAYIFLSLYVQYERSPYKSYDRYQHIDETSSAERYHSF